MHAKRSTKKCIWLPLLICNNPDYSILDIGLIPNFVSVRAISGVLAAEAMLSVYLWCSSVLVSLAPCLMLLPSGQLLHYLLCPIQPMLLLSRCIYYFRVCLPASKAHYICIFLFLCRLCVFFFLLSFFCNSILVEFLQSHVVVAGSWGVKRQFEPSFPCQHRPPI